MSVFIHDDFLLDTSEAVELYHRYAENQPILDYHCHLDSSKLAADYVFANIAEAWLHGDHYKWRAMRTLGIDERYCSGRASDHEKFLQWAGALPKLLRNPLYHWTHLELKRPFGIDDLLLSSATAETVWRRAGTLLKEPNFGARGILKQMNVELVCTTDDPTDSLEAHLAHAKSDDGVRMLPTWRPDRARAIAEPTVFEAWIFRLSEAAQMPVQSFSDFIAVLQKRHSFFAAAGCRLSDHSIERMGCHHPNSTEAEAIFQAVRQGVTPTTEQIDSFSLYMLYLFGTWDAAAGWTQQYHIGALRNPNRRTYEQLGPDTGFDAINDINFAVPLAAHLSRLTEADALPKTILYNLNPRDNASLAVLCGSFQDGITAGKIQFGPAWWFLDQLEGMKVQIESLSQLGILSCFTGMVTDSRSFLSYTRHEYFRRILCRILGREMHEGVIPNDLHWVGNMVSDLAYRNAKNYFKF